MHKINKLKSTDFILLVVMYNMFKNKEPIINNLKSFNISADIYV